MPGTARKRKVSAAPTHPSEEVGTGQPKAHRTDSSVSAPDHPGARVVVKRVVFDVPTKPKPKPDPDLVDGDAGARSGSSGRADAGGGGGGGAQPPAARRVQRALAVSTRTRGRGNGGGGRPAAQEKFMPPLPLPDAPFEMSVQNLVFTGVLGTLVRLRHVVAALAHCGAELNQKRFSAVILRSHLSARAGPLDEDILLQQLRPVVIARPRLDKIAVLIFRNGNLVCTGAKTFAQARYMLLRTAQQLRDIGYKDAKIVRMNIRNMVGRAQLPCRIDRERMAREIPAFATYAPAHFPGVSVKHPLTGLITLLVFDSGRVVVTGTRSKPVADAALARIKPLLVHFDVNTPPGTPVPDIAWPGEVVETALYDVLGVDPKATMKEITSAFRQKARKLHPDKNVHLAPGSVELADATRAYKRASAAYELLQDPVRRDAYDFTGDGRDVIDIAEETESDDDDEMDDEIVAAIVEEAVTMEDLMEAAKSDDDD